MNILAPVKSIMSTDLITLAPQDKLLEAKDIFENHNIHHIPVVRFKTIVGMVSKSDFLFFVRGFQRSEEDRFVNEARLRAYSVQEIMTTGLAKLSPNDRLDVALDLFLTNRFHAIPVVENDALVGIVTTFDVIKAVNREAITVDQILESQKTA